MNYIVQERQSYHHHATLGTNFSHTYMSLIIDFSEKLLLPHRIPFIKKWLRLTNRYSITPNGIIDHGYGHYLYCYPTHQWSKDPNMVISLLYQHIHDHLSDSNKHSKTLYLQADNCAAENKHQWMLAFLSLLVYKKIFIDIYLGFLPTGHTHEDVDQMFSVFRKKLDAKSAHSPEALFALLGEAYNTSEIHPHILNVKNVWDWKTWFQQHLHQVSNHTKPRCYHFFTSASGRAVFCAKAGMSDGTWGPEHDIFATYPSGEPFPLTPLNIPGSTKSETERVLKSKIFTTAEQELWNTILNQPLSSLITVFPDFQRINLPDDSTSQINQSETSVVDVHMQERTSFSRVDLNFYPEQFIIIRPDQEQASTDHFWLAKILKVCRCKLRIHYYKNKNSIWKPTKQVSKEYVWPEAVILILPNSFTHSLQLSNLMINQIRALI